MTTACYHKSKKKFVNYGAKFSNSHIVSRPFDQTSLSQNETTGTPIIIAPQLSPRIMAPKSIMPRPIVQTSQGGFVVAVSSQQQQQPPRTFYFINNRSGGQSVLLSSSSNSQTTVRKIPYSGNTGHSIIESNQISRVRGNPSSIQAIVSTSGPRLSSFVVAQQQQQQQQHKMTQQQQNVLCVSQHRVPNSSGMTVLQHGELNPNSFHLLPNRPITAPTEIMFASRSIDADGTVKTVKEFLCNFCQFKVADQSVYETHKATHSFSCNYCSFRAYSRFDVLRHKKELHPQSSEELAGYIELDKMIESYSMMAASSSSSFFPTSSSSSLIPQTSSSSSLLIQPSSSFSSSSGAYSLLQPSSNRLVASVSGTRTVFTFMPSLSSSSSSSSSSVAAVAVVSSSSLSSSSSSSSSRVVHSLKAPTISQRLWLPNQSNSSSNQAVQQQQQQPQQREDGDAGGNVNDGGESNNINMNNDDDNNSNSARNNVDKNSNRDVANGDSNTGQQDDVEAKDKQLQKNSKSLAPSKTDNGRSASKNSNASDSTDIEMDKMKALSGNSSNENRVTDAAATKTRSSRPRRAATKSKQCRDYDFSDDNGNNVDVDDNDYEWEESSSSSKRRKSSKKNKDEFISQASNDSRDSSKAKENVIVVASTAATTTTATAATTMIHSVSLASLLTSTNIFKYQCNICQFATFSKESIESHSKIHDKSSFTSTTQSLATSTTTSYNNNNKPETMTTTSISKLISSPSTAVPNVKWSCFYCEFATSIQATVVNHVVHAHPSQPIQLKRIAFNPGVFNTAGKPNDSNSANSNIGSSCSRNSILNVTAGVGSPRNLNTSTACSTIMSTDNNTMQHLTAQQSTTASPSLLPTSATLTLTSAATTATITTTATASAQDSGGCLWGCYYCSAQSIDRSQIIQHLKKEHVNSKLVVTRRRITHVPTVSAKISETPDNAAGGVAKNTDSDINGGSIFSTTCATPSTDIVSSGNAINANIITTKDSNSAEALTTSSITTNTTTATGANDTLSKESDSKLLEPVAKSAKRNCRRSKKTSIAGNHSNSNNDQQSDQQQHRSLRSRKEDSTDDPTKLFEEIHPPKRRKTSASPAATSTTAAASTATTATITTSNSDNPIDLPDETMTTLSSSTTDDSNSRMSPPLLRIDLAEDEENSEKCIPNLNANNSPNKTVNDSCSTDGSSKLAIDINSSYDDTINSVIANCCMYDDENEDDGGLDDGDNNKEVSNNFYKTMENKSYTSNKTRVNSAAMQWKCAYCPFGAMLRNKIVQHVTSIHCNCPVKFFNIGSFGYTCMSDLEMEIEPELNFA
ncbi:hypothetical protein HELRODRAFT_172045 [Helobdella robusta]|uniref:C2H2-type domain-containing protein n=1 Tax=Helobdella robusta TaxID=6412 RepID=T1F4Z1_HELRO|nr:hypothetical protein HELRODRAFT_172045 [Helobdella robusta]ESO05032.1 hypothetical protein HELRODRAFT_172045 [Helobdella robusta]